MNKSEITKNLKRWIKKNINLISPKYLLYIQAKNERLHPFYIYIKKIYIGPIMRCRAPFLYVYIYAYIYAYIYVHV